MITFCRRRDKCKFYQNGYRLCELCSNDLMNEKVIINYNHYSLLLSTNNEEHKYNDHHIPNIPISPRGNDNDNNMAKD